MAKTIYTYSCEFCSTDNTRPYEINQSYRCKSCQKSSKPILKNVSGATQQEAEIKQQLADIKAETPNIKTETINYNVPKQNIQPINTSNNSSSYTPNYNGAVNQTTKTFSEDSVIKYFEATDKMMKKKCDEWDITKDEEKIVANAWTEWLNDFFAHIKPQTAKLLMATATTIVVYTPRVVTYVGKIVEMQEKKKKKSDNEEPETKQTTQELLDNAENKSSDVKDVFSSKKIEGGKYGY